MGRQSGRGLMLSNEMNTKPNSHFYALSATLANGKTFDFKQLKDKHVVIVNTASDCGYTRQFEELQTLFEKHNDRVAILGFPANDFKNQEKGDNDEIVRFCQINYGVTFPIMQKCVVITVETQHPVYQWLTTPQQNGWCGHQPDWNFSKYIIDDKGILTHYFGPAIAPNDPVFMDALMK